MQNILGDIVKVFVKSIYNLPLVFWNSFFILFFIKKAGWTLHVTLKCGFYMYINPICKITLYTITLLLYVYWYLPITSLLCFPHYFVSLDIQREEEKVKRSIKDAAKKGQKDVCVILAKEMIQSKRAVSKLYASKAQMNSVLLSMKNQLGEYAMTASWVVGYRGINGTFSIIRLFWTTSSQ